MMMGQAETFSSVQSFPPGGWVTNREAARLLGVSLNTLTAINWKWRGMMRGQCRCVRHPSGGRCNIYTVAAIEDIFKARAEWEQRQIPKGFIDKDGACRMFNIEKHTWKKWINDGKVGFGKRLPGPNHARVMVYRVEDVERLRDELFGEDKLYKDGKTGRYHVPAEFITREEAWERFGVSRTVWERWEREGKITCGERVPGGPKLYKVEEINRMLDDEYGRWAPPYPDPEQPCVYRVPLSGRDIKRREAIIDADVLPLIEGCSCNWSTGDGDFGVCRVLAFLRWRLKSVASSHHGDQRAKNLT